MPKVSIITPCYNCDRYIGKTIESVRAQTFTDWEHIVVDDGSCDRSAEIVQRYAATDQRLHLTQQTNRGVANARNVGFTSVSDSQYLLFLDGDDCLKPEMLETLTSYLDQNSEVGLVYCDRACVDSNDALLESPYFPRYIPDRYQVCELPNECPETPFVSVFNLAPIIPSVSVIRRSAYQQTPGWDETFGQHYEDTDLFLGIAIRSQIHYLDQKLVHYRQHNQQSTADTNKFLIQERKLYQKWLTSTTLTPEQKAVVQSAWRFREGRVIPHAGFCAGNRHLRKGEILTALRFYVGAIRRYVGSFLPSSFLVHDRLT